MDTIYEKLIEQLKAMTPEKANAEWEELKDYNFGPSLEEYERIVMQYQALTLQRFSSDYFIMTFQKFDNESNNPYYLAA